MKAMYFIIYYSGTSSMISTVTNAVHSEFHLTKNAEAVYFLHIISTIYISVCNRAVVTDTEHNLLPIGEKQNIIKMVDAYSNTEIPHH